MSYGFGNPGPGLGQAQKCDSIKSVNRIPTIPSSNTDINKQSKTCLFIFLGFDV